MIVQIVEPEKALSGCCPGISAAVACFRTCWELKLACRKGLWTEPCQPLFCSSDFFWEHGWQLSYVPMADLCAHVLGLCVRRKRFPEFFSLLLSELDRFQKSQSKKI